MKYIVLMLCFLFLTSSFAAKDEKYYDYKTIPIQEMKYLMEDGKYDDVVGEAAKHLSDPKISFSAMEEISTLRIKAYYELRQYAVVNKLFADYRFDFSESPYMLELVQLDMDSHARRRHYYEAVISCSDAMDRAEGKQQQLYDELHNIGREMIIDELTKKELKEIFFNVNEPLKVILRQRMKDEGMDLPEEHGGIVYEVWNEKVTRNHFLGSALVGMSLPISMNEELSFGLSMQFTGLYRIYNFIAPGAHIELNLWRYPVSDEVTVHDVNTDESSGHISYAIPIVAVGRFNAPQVERFKFYIEPGVGGSIYTADATLIDPEFRFTVMTDLGIIFNDMIELRPGMRMLFKDGDNVSWFSLSVGMSVKRLK